MVTRQHTEAPLSAPSGATDPDIRPAMHRTFRPNVAALIEHAGLYLACERTDRPGVWQSVQGGIDAEDASPEDALLREMREEIGALREHFVVERRSRAWRRYEFPPDLAPRPGRNFRGQDQLWFLVRLIRPEGLALSRSEGEFRDARWVTLADLCAATVHWKRGILEDFSRELGLL